MADETKIRLSADELRFLREMLTERWEAGQRLVYAIGTLEALLDQAEECLRLRSGAEGS